MTARTPSADSNTDSTQGRNPAIDGIKGVAILAVLLLHSVPRQTLYDSHALFHIWQAVPVFVLLMGYTGSITRVKPLARYAVRRAQRLLPAFVGVWVLSYLLTRLWTGSVEWNPLWLVGVLPTIGPGNYFVTLLIEFTLILPGLRWLLDRAGERWFLACCLAVNVAFEIAAGWFMWDGYLYQSCVLRMLLIVALGMLLARGWRVWLLFPLSAAYLAIVDRGIVLPLLVAQGQAQSFLAAGYAAGIVAGGLRLSYPTWLQSLGRASYHVFLIQIVWFAQVAPHLRSSGHAPAASLPVGIAACALAGLAAKWIEDRAFERACGALY